MTTYSPLSREDAELLMLTRFSELKPDVTLKKSSVAGTILATLSTFVEGQEQVISDLTNQSFLTSSSGQFLDALAEDRGFERKSALPATGTVSFSRQSAAVSDILIPTDTIIQTEPDANNLYSTYKTLSDVSILTGEFQKTVSVECEKTGTLGNVVAGGTGSIVSGDAVFTTNTYGASSNSYELEVVDNGALSVSVSGAKVTIEIDSGTTTIDDVKTAIEANASVNNLISLESSASVMPLITSQFFTGGYDGEINVFAASISGVDFVTNIEDFTDGQKRETDTDFRDRVIDGLSDNFGKGTEAWYERIALEVDDVKTATVISHTNRVAQISCGDDTNRMTFLAKTYGEYGNDISVQVLDTGSLSISVSSLEIAINIDSGVTTLQDVYDAIYADTLARALIVPSFDVDGGEFIQTLTLANLEGGFNDDFPPNQITVYITQDNDDGFPDTALIDATETYLSSDDNRLVCDYIVVKSPDPQDITVTCEITEYDPNYTEADVRADVKSSLLDYVAGLQTGEKMYVKSLEKIIIDTAGVLDFNLTSPSANVQPSETEKVRLQDANCTIT